jgi:DNA helicase II / ATP-dependent DNA helicase PcrA
MTIHAAKGLEFPYVFIVGLEENLFPSIQSISTRAELEEERRLFYVALTRAMKKVTLTYAESRYRWGQFTLTEPSRFLEEIDETLIDKPRKAVLNRPAGSPPPRQSERTTVQPHRNLQPIDHVPYDSSNFEASDTTDLMTGMNVEHPKFGKGKVIAVEGNGSNKKATVFFNGIGNKSLLLRFAKLKIVT